MYLPGSTYVDGSERGRSVKLSNRYPLYHNVDKVAACNIIDCHTVENAVKIRQTVRRLRVPVQQGDS